MSQNLGDNAQGRISDHEHADLEALLKRKLHGIPSSHIHALSLSDIIFQSPRALSLPNIPPDIQLGFLLRNRALIDQHGGKPVKDEGEQSLDITRLIWYYRIDPAHQFQRYHDTGRWNIALFIALLTLPSDAPPPPHTPTAPAAMRPARGIPSPKATHIPPAARRFMTVYLAAVLEHHNTPATFTARENIIITWRSGIWDLFEVNGSGQKKFLKNEMKRLTREWEIELDDAMRRMGRAEYDARIAKFVNSLVPGREDQGLPPTLHTHSGLVTPSPSPEIERDTDGDVAVTPGEEIEGSSEGRDGVRNELLEALRVPFVEQSEQRSMDSYGTTTVTDLRYAIGVVQKVRPKDMLPVLMRLFPAEDK